MEALLARSSGMTAKAGRDGVNNALGRRDCRAAQGPGLALQCTECVRCVCLFCTIGECNITGKISYDPGLTSQVAHVIMT